MQLREGFWFVIPAYAGDSREVGQNGGSGHVGAFLLRHYWSEMQIENKRQSEMSGVGHFWIPAYAGMT